MKKNIIALTILLVLDVISTILVLTLFEDAKELNPILNITQNIILSVTITHILAIMIVWWVYIYSNRKYKDKPETLKTIKTNLMLVNIFYIIVVSSNFIQLIMHLFKN